MKLLRKNKFLQLLVGLVSILLVLGSGWFLVNKIQLLEIPEASAIEIAFCVIYPILFAGFMISFSFISKKYSMEYLFRTVFGISFISGASAYIVCCLEGSVSLLFWGLILIPLGKPFTEISKGLSGLLEYTTEYSEKFNYMYEWDFLIIFLGITIVSLIIYQCTVKTEEQREKYLKWRLDSSTERLAKIMIGTFGGYAFLADIYFALPYCKAADWIMVFLLTPVALGLTMTFIIYILPIALCGVLIFKGIKQAKEENSIRKILHPYIIAAIVSTLAGCNSIFQIAIESF